jgi:uncharacterized protein with PIN domain
LAAAKRATIRTQKENLVRLNQIGFRAMQDGLDNPPIVRCPGCNQPMEAKERTRVAEGLVDIRYVCAGCGMETKRTIAHEAR